MRSNDGHVGVPAGARAPSSTGHSATGWGIDDVGAVLAVKHLDGAKTRLAASRPPEDPDTTPAHRDLVLAMLLDTVAAVSAAGVGPIVVVTPDDDVLRTVARTGAAGLREQQHPRPSLNLAYLQGAAWLRARHPRLRMAMMVQADLPAATGTALAEVLGAASAHRAALLADADGDGTALLIRPIFAADAPAFGVDSAAAHRRSGAVELDPARRRWTELRTDVDTAADLDAAVALGVGTHTREVLATSFTGRPAR
ncbi:2-phospho-L-lactate guanylyltransferase [Gordonia sp. NB41Y]|uniref:2-phospho-L-lactate guanylyltransferase n=1 Tax=Gordonia sp. NB41Y TaxID=875808 RepID=UPI00273C3EC0|nr:2-phospho-L-lactate guanylyltransferase [Gordonia sp. NB41Y]WLP90154.1 2-phospho-L-lactate guanylyltransferase [Gordonia sp. NB41Y]